MLPVLVKRWPLRVIPHMSASVRECGRGLESQLSVTGKCTHRAKLHSDFDSGQMAGTQSSREQMTDSQIETSFRSVLLPKLCSCLRIWARRRETRLGIDVVFRMKSSAPALREAVS
jgi:hypothetical protein